MCYFPRRILNKRFLPTKKNNFHPPVCTDERFRYIEVECGHCFECRKKKRREWRIRNYEQLKETPTAVFFTGTVSSERYEYIKNRYGLEDDNEIITKIHRLFLERIRKQMGFSIKHWTVTEKGHTNTRRIHLHGLYYTPEGMSKFTLVNLLRNNWIDGYCYNGKYVNEKTINYVSKYMTKKDEDNPDFQGKVLCSPGLGRKFVDEKKNRYKWNGQETKEDYYCKNGQLLALPRYYKTKLFTEEQRELLWMYREDKGEKYIRGTKYIVKTEEQQKEYECQRDEKNRTWAAIHGDRFEEITLKAYVNRMRKLASKYNRLCQMKDIDRRRLEKMEKQLDMDLEEYRRTWIRD